MLSVFLKILIGFWIIALVVGLFKPERISEFGAKFFGIELSHKYSADMLIIKESQEKLEKQIAIINDLNKEILEFISGPFEGHIMKAKDKPKIIRQIVKGILTKVEGDYTNLGHYHISGGCYFTAGAFGNRMGPDLSVHFPAGSSHVLESSIFSILAVAWDKDVDAFESAYRRDSWVDFETDFLGKELNSGPNHVYKIPFLRII